MRRIARRVIERMHYEYGVSQYNISDEFDNDEELDPNDIWNQDEWPQETGHHFSFTSADEEVVRDAPATEQFAESSEHAYMYPSNDPRHRRS